MVHGFVALVPPNKEHLKSPRCCFRGILQDEAFPYPCHRRKRTRVHNNNICPLCIKYTVKIITIASFPGNMNIPLTTFPGGYEYSLAVVTGTGNIHEPIPLKLGYNMQCASKEEGDK